MCDAPILIKNSNFNSPISDPTYHLLHNTTSPYIPVPCGHCMSCVHLRQIYLVQRVQMESINNDLFYGTLTYNKESIPTVTYGDLSFAYPDYSDWQRMIKLIRKHYPDLHFKYLLVSEYGGRKHRPHFHFILSVPKTSDLLADKWSTATKLHSIFLSYWRRNYGSTRSPIWKPLCTYVNLGGRYNFDLHWLDPNSSKDGTDGVSFYVTKYLLKFDSWVDKFKSKLFYTLSYEDYKDAYSKFRPRCLLSKGFGSPSDIAVINHIVKGIQFALDSDSFFPYFTSLVSGDTYPLAPYYQKKFLTTSEQIIFKSRCPDTILDPVKIDAFDKRQSHLSLMRSFLLDQNSILDFDDMIDINDNIINNGNYQKTPFLDSVFTDSREDFICRRDTSGSDSDDFLYFMWLYNKSGHKKRC